MIQNINDKLGQARTKFALAVTGAAMTGATDFFRGTGASAFIEAVEIPYGYKAWEKLIGAESCAILGPKVTQQGADVLARVMLIKYDCDIGIGVSGKLAIPNEREGRENVVYYSAASNGRIIDRLLLNLYSSTREEQEVLASKTLHEFMLRNIKGIDPD